MRAPAFWWSQKPGATAIALSPLSWIWSLVSARRMRRIGAQSQLFVICVGNFVAGGAGKTPTAIACARILTELGFRPVFLSRGYGGSASRNKTPLRIEARHDAQIVGDEAILLARHAPAIVAADRVAGAQAAIATGCDVIVMDDGLQNPSLAKDFSIVVVDGETGVGNGMCMPAGPLRAPLQTQFEMIDALIVVGRGDAGDKLAGRAQARGIPVFYTVLEPDPFAAARLRGQRVVAFAGIGRPEKFFASLESVGANVVEAYSFDDHQMLDEANMSALRDASRRHAATLVTTEKDMARIADRRDTQGIDVLPVTLKLEDEDQFAALIRRALVRRWINAPSTGES